jgi:hypothetical protein
LLDDVTFAEFDCNPNFVHDDILRDVVAHSGNYRQYRPYRMDFVRNGIVDSLMEQ